MYSGDEFYDDDVTSGVSPDLIQFPQQSVEPSPYVCAHCFNAIVKVQVSPNTEPLWMHEANVQHGGITVDYVWQCGDAAPGHVAEIHT